MFPGSINKNTSSFNNLFQGGLPDSDTIYDYRDLNSEYYNDSDSDLEWEKIVPEEDNKKDTNELKSDLDNISKKFYNYNITSSLKKNYSYINDENLIQSPIHLGIFHINNDTLYPYLSYYLIKNYFYNSLQFPYLTLSSECNVEKEVDIFMKQFSIYQYNLHGYKMFNNEIYIFIEVKDLNQMNIDYTNNSFVLIDELVNTKKVFDLIIDNNTTDFFIKNTEFIYLLDETNKPYEIPIVAYQGIEEKKINFTFMFGHTKSNFTDLMGPYFYFTSYKNVLNKFNDKKMKFGIIRYGLFLGCMKIPMNFPEDEIDNSDIKKVLLNDENFQQKAILTMRISDHDGCWTQLYDSVYIGRTELDNGEFLEDTPTWVIKNYQQQFSLSYKINYPKIKII